MEYDFQEMRNQSESLCGYAGMLIADIVSELDRLEKENKLAKADTEYLYKLKRQLEDWSDSHGK